jgi:hypothetical protein
LSGSRQIGEPLEWQLGTIFRSSEQRLTGARGRAVIRTMFARIADTANSEQRDTADAASDLGPITQTLTYSGEPRVIARLDMGAMVRLAQTTNAVLVLDCGVGETRTGVFRKC